jgi:hypothetical protein
LNVVVPVRYQEGDRRETLDDLSMRFRPCEALQQFLEHKPCAVDGTGIQRRPQVIYLRYRRRRMATKSQ